MIASMTGYGKSSFANDNIKITVEIKSINSKQFDLLLRVPSMFREQEMILRKKLATLLERGKIEVSVYMENLSDQAPMKINIPVVMAYRKQLKSLSMQTGLEEPDDKDLIPLLLRLPESLTSDSKEADEQENEVLINTVLEAVENFNNSRLQEGKGLYEFFFNKIERIRGYLEHTENYEVNRVEKIRERIELQLGRLQGIEIDRGRLEQEMIFYVEKLDVTEEKQRLRSHLNYFEETLGSPDEEQVGGKGKKLGFISQEMGREINTLGSKSNDAEMQKLVVMMKDELEQIKEQVLNVL